MMLFYNQNPFYITWYFVGEFVYGEGQKKWDKYVGEFRDGMFDGNGTYFSNDGSRYDEIFYSENDGMLLSFYHI